MLTVDVGALLGAFALRPRFETEGGTTVLFGPSGSGKSLTLAAIAGLLRPQRGSVVADGHVLFDAGRGVDLPPERRRIGYLPQGYGLFPHLTIGQNIAFGLRRLPRAEACRRVADALKLLRIEGLETRYPNQVSGGQAQRVALARALVVRPRVLLLDEPFAALDTEIRRVLRAELVDLQRHLGIHVLFVTHDLAEAHAVGDRMVVYDRGEVLQCGPVDAVVDRPRSRRVAELVATRNVLLGRVVDQTRDGLVVALGAERLTAPHRPIAPGTSVDICIRPEQVLLVRSGERTHAGARRNLLPARIVREVAQGAFHTLYMRLEPPVRPDRDYDIEVDVPTHPYEVMGVAQRRDWVVSLNPGALHLIERR